MQAPKTPPRFLPTLTEVVRPTVPLTEALADTPREGPASALSAEQAMVDAVLARLLPSLELQVQAAVRDSLQARLDDMLPAVLSEVQNAVRCAVEDAVRQTP